MNVKKAVLVICPLFFGSTINAITFDWDSPLIDWTQTGSPGSHLSYSQAFNVGQTIVTISVSQVNGVTLAVAPDDITTLTGGYIPAPQNLFINNNLANHRTDTDYTLVSIGFSETVKNVVFEIFDVDYYAPNPYQDLVTIRGRTGSGYYVDPSSVIPLDLSYARMITSNEAVSFRSFFGASNIYSANSVIGLQEVDDHSNLGNITASFFQNIDRIDIYYRNSYRVSNDKWDPGNQWIGISDVSYDIIPEPQSFLMMFLALTSLARTRRRPRFFSPR